MGYRRALKPNTPLSLYNERGESFKCVIKNVLGRGASCIVYYAVRITDTGDVSFYRVK